MPHRPPPPRPAPVSSVVQRPTNEVSVQGENVEFSTPVVVQSDVDLLNLSQEKQSVRQNEKSKVKEPSFDLLGSFESSAESNPIPDLIDTTMKNPASGGNLDDIFGSISNQTNTNNNNIPSNITQSKSSSDLEGLNLNFDSTTKTSNQRNIPDQAAPSQKSFDLFGDFFTKENSNKTQPQQKSKDPFDLGNLGASLNPNWGQSFNKTTQFSSPNHQSYGSAPTTASASPKAPSTPIHQMKSPTESSRPDYSRSNFAEPNANTTNGTTNPKSKSTDIFGDILGQQGYSFGSKNNQGPRTINDMRKDEMVKDGMDPERLKILEWVSL